MAISTIGTDALAASAVTSTKLASGVPSRSQLPAGTVLQVVKATVTGDTGTTSANYVTTNLYATITPTASTSKILCLASSNISNVANTGNQLWSCFYRGTSGNGSGSLIGADGYYWVTYTNTSYQSSQMMYVDSPASTSALTYTVMHRSGTAGQSVGWCYGLGSANVGTLVLMEIAG